MTLSVKFIIAESRYFQEKMKRPEYRKIYPKLLEYVYPQLRENPFFGQNIKKLKGEFAQTYRYRVGKMRLFYVIEKDKIIVVIADIAQRKDAY